MSAPSVAHTHHENAMFRHEALLYAGAEEFAAGCTSFIREGLEYGEPTLVVVDAPKIELLRDALGSEADEVEFADMAEVGANPARIIPAWREFVARSGGSSQPIRGIGEPARPERTAAEMTECHRHEALLNLAFADAGPFRLLCPYDTIALDPEVIIEAHRTHPYVIRAGRHAQSLGYGGLELAASPFAAPLDPPPENAERLEFDRDSIDAVRGVIDRRARLAGLSITRCQDLVLAVNEMATNSVLHGGGRGILRAWTEHDRLLCEISDGGQLNYPLVGRIQPTAGQVGGFGVWLANQICDLVQIRSFESGTVVRLHMLRD